MSTAVVVYAEHWPRKPQISLRNTEAICRQSRMHRAKKQPFEAARLVYQAQKELNIHNKILIFILTYKGDPYNCGMWKILFLNFVSKQDLKP